MRVLLLPLFLALAAAAPSTIEQHVQTTQQFDIKQKIITPVVKAIPIADPGDVEAAVINQKVQLEDQAQLSSDLARDRAELDLETKKGKSIEINDLAKENNEEAFWSNEEKKWQALEAVNTAEARLDGALASQAGNFPVQYLPTYIQAIPQIKLTPLHQITPLQIQPISPIIPNYVSPLVYSSIIKTEDKEKKTENKEKEFLIKDGNKEIKSEASVKSAEQKETTKSAEQQKETKPLAIAPLSPLFVAPAGVNPTFYGAAPAVYPLLQHLQAPLVTSQLGHFGTPYISQTLIKQW